MKIVYKSILSALLGLCIVSGCDTDDLHDLNVNPQAVSQIDLHYLFSAAQLGIASNGTSGDNRYTDWRTNIGLASTAIQQLATTADISTAGMYYRHNEETSTAVFEFTYNDQLKNIAEILRQTGPGGYAEGELNNVRNASRILKAWSFQRLTDFYGAVPYFEANRGLEKNFFPSYDNQSVIYPDLLRELDEAAAALDPADPDEDFKASDLIYDGDIEKWRRFGYSIMLRIAMRASNVAPDLAAEYVAKAVQGGVFESNEDNVWVRMAEGPSLWSNQNGISRAFLPGDGGNPSYLSKTLVDFLKGTDQNVVTDDDPRLMILTDGIGLWNAEEWTPLNQDPLDQRGMPSGTFFDTQAALLGVNDFQLDTTYSRISPYLLDRDDPYMIMNYAEVEFLLAEAA
ncbi:MAG TPA: SusD/RagB family nutrient-binding outer membrane lipoprotein, partial [Chryseosolibacter sp.]